MCFPVADEPDGRWHPSCSNHGRYTPVGRDHPRDHAASHPADWAASVVCLARQVVLRTGARVVPHPPRVDQPERSLRGSVGVLRRVANPVLATHSVGLEWPESVHLPGVVCVVTRCSALLELVPELPVVVRRTDRSCVPPTVTHVEWEVTRSWWFATDRRDGHTMECAPCFCFASCLLRRLAGSSGGEHSRELVVVPLSAVAVVAIAALALSSTAARHQARGLL